MTKWHTKGVKYDTLRWDCLTTIRSWPGCESVQDLRLCRKTAGGFSIEVTAFGVTNVRLANRVAKYVEREKRRNLFLED